MVAAARLPVAPVATPRWGFAALAGRLVELSAARAPATLTAACWLTRDAQRLGETTAWVTPASHCFFPPDAAAMGVDLAALVVARVPALADVPRAVERLLRSGAFGLVVGDLWAVGTGASACPPALQSRLAGLVQRHHAVVCCLTATPLDAPSLGSLVSLRVVATRLVPEEGSEPSRAIHLTAIKDKRHAPGWTQTLAGCPGPAGLR